VIYYSIVTNLYLASFLRYNELHAEKRGFHLPHLIRRSQIWQSCTSNFWTILGSPSTGRITLLNVKLLSDYPSVCAHNPQMLQTYRRTDGWTDGRHSHCNTALRTYERAYVLREVKSHVSDFIIDTEIKATRLSHLSSHVVCRDINLVLCISRRWRHRGRGRCALQEWLESWYQCAAQDCFGWSEPVAPSSEYHLTSHCISSRQRHFSDTATIRARRSQSNYDNT